MSPDEKRRQQARRRLAAKREQKRRALQRAGSPRPPTLLRSAATWPVMECLVSREWQQAGALVHVVVARRSAAGAVAAAVFLVDLACLGVKDAFAQVFTSLGEYEHLRRRLGAAQTLVPADLDLVARIIREGIACARQLGFEPHPDYPAAAVLLQGAQPEACHVTVPLGKDGKPFFVAGPHDDVPRILAQLTRSVGSENFTYLIPLEMPRPFLDEGEG